MKFSRLVSIHARNNSLDFEKDMMSAYLRQRIKLSYLYTDLDVIFKIGQHLYKEQFIRF